MDHSRRNAFLITAALAACFAAALVLRLPSPPAPQPEPVPEPPAPEAPSPGPSAPGEPPAAPAPAPAAQAAPAVDPDSAAVQREAEKIANKVLKAALGGALTPASEYERGVNDFRSRLLAEADAVRRGGRHQFVEMTDLALEPGRYRGRSLAVMGILNFLDLHSARPHFNLGDDFGGAAGSLAVSVATFDLARKRGLLGLEGTAKPNVVEVFGRMLATPQGEYYLEAAEVRNLGAMPQGVIAPVSELLRKPYASPAPGSWLRDKGRPVRAAARELAKDRTRPLVEIQDLILSPEAYFGRELSTIGIIGHAQANAQDSYFSLGPSFATQNLIQVRMTGLPLESRKAVLRLQFPPQALAVRGVMRRAPNGAYFLEAAGVSFIGDAPESIPQALTQGN